MSDQKSKPFLSPKVAIFDEQKERLKIKESYNRIKHRVTDSETDFIENILKFNAEARLFKAHDALLRKIYDKRKAEITAELTAIGKRNCYKYRICK
jgi:hypothetical protein